MLWESKDSASWSVIREILQTEPTWRDNPLTEEEAGVDIRNSGFLIRDLDDRYRFIHRSIMEFFAAKVQLNRLSNGDKPRHIPTDGFRMFLSMLIAKKWAQEKTCPLPPLAWDQARGEAVIEAQLSLLAAASKDFSKDERCPLLGVRGARILADQNWQQVDFRDVHFRPQKGNFVFEDCTFQNSSILASDGATILLKKCSVSGLNLSLAIASQISIGKLELNSHENSLELPEFVWNLASLVENGAKINIAGTDWQLTRNDLCLFGEAISRIKGKIAKKNFAKGSMRSELSRILPILRRQKFIHEDSSRSEHQIALSVQGRELLGRFRNTPVETQKEIMALVRKAPGRKPKIGSM